MTTVRLPLFPLNSVLFPGLVLPLNIFEERYRAMMRDLLKTPEEDSRRFAVVAIRDGHEVASTAPGMPDQTAVPERGPTAGFGPDPLKAFHSVGCVADAATIRERADGTFEVLATGTTRMRLLSVDASGPFLTAELEELPEEKGDEAGRARGGRATRVPPVPEASRGRPRTHPVDGRGRTPRRTGGGLLSGGRGDDAGHGDQTTPPPGPRHRLPPARRTETPPLRDGHHPQPAVPPGIGPDPRPDKPELTPEAGHSMPKKPKNQQSGGTPATVALTTAGVPYELHAYDHDPAHPSYGEEAAEAMGVSPDRVFKTLLADVDGTLTVAVVPVAGQLDLKALASAVGGKRATMADPTLAERTTGYVRGGISPWANARSSARSWTPQPPPTPRSASRQAAEAWRWNSPRRT